MHSKILFSAMEKIHFIAIGGETMHNIAITLSKMGYEVTGSDDQLLEPSRSRLKAHNLLPEETGWFPEKITLELEAVIIGMHAKEDNPELKRARELGLKICSYSEFIYLLSKNKTKILISGSYGKTTITTMVMHVLSNLSIKHDFIVGTQLEGYTSRVKLSKSASIIIIDGDEKPSSSIDPRPKFMQYKPDIALLTGIAWEHVELFPDKNEYIGHYDRLIGSIQPQGTLIHSSSDIKLSEHIKKHVKAITTLAYEEHSYELFDNRNFLAIPSGRIPLYLFGAHNMQNISGAKAVCQQLGISDEKFYTAIKSYKGTTKHLQMLGTNHSTNVYLDLAFSPVKLNASVTSVAKQFPGRRLVVFLELPSSTNINEEYLLQYKGSLKHADVAYIYYNKEHLSSSNNTIVSKAAIVTGFDYSALQIFDEAVKATTNLIKENWKDTNLLIVSAGNFSAVDFSDLSERVLETNTL